MERNYMLQEFALSTILSRTLQYYIEEVKHSSTQQFIRCVDLLVGITFFWKTGSNDLTKEDYLWNKDRDSDANTQNELMSWLDGHIDDQIVHIHRTPYAHSNICSFTVRANRS